MSKELCIKCNKEFKTKDLFLQWTTNGDAYICEDCIKEHKQYLIDPCYADDITFIFARAIVTITKHDILDLSQTLIGYYYGPPDDEDSKRILNDWLTKDVKIRKDLIRQAFNENGKYNKEVLY